MLHAQNGCKTPYRPRPRSILLRTSVLASVIIPPRKALSGPDEAQGNADVLKMFRKRNIHVDNQSVYRVIVTETSV